MSSTSLGPKQNRFLGVSTVAGAEVDESKAVILSMPLTSTNKSKSKPQMPPHVGFVDLRSHYDETLFQRFYNEMLIPNFPDPDELDSFEYIKGMVKKAAIEDDTLSHDEIYLDYHVVVMASFPEPYNPNNKYDFSKDKFKGEFMGAVVFEYYVQANAGLLTYLLVESKFRGLQLGKVLSDKCREKLEAQSKARGHLAGCNAIFLETNSAVKISQDRLDTMEPAKRHEIFYSMGLRLVDFDYVQPPLDTDKNKVNYLLLCCFITPRVPSFLIGNKEQYYLPANLVKNTMHAFWVNSPMKGRKFSDDVDYKRMQDQLKRRERILLLDLPWERPFTVIDLAEHFDLELLVQFYQDLLVPCYKGRLDELDSLDRWLEKLSPKQIVQDDSVKCHLLLALKYSDDEEENSKPVIAGGLALEYFPGNNCGFLNYLLAPVGSSGERMARLLIDRAIGELDNDAKSRGQLAGCNVIFMECVQSGSHYVAPAPIPAPKKITSEPVSLPELGHTEVRDIDEQHPLLESMGWKLVDFDYVQPPNRDPTKKVKTSLLVALVTARIPVLSQEGKSQHYIPSTTLKKFMTELWDQVCDGLSYDYTNDSDFNTMIDSIDRRPRIPLLGRPWTKPWTMFDLQEQGNSQLLVQFYDELLQPAYSTRRNDLDSIEGWKKRLTRNRTGDIFHVLVAIKTALDDSNTSAALLGGLSFHYFEGTNCGFINHVLIKEVNSREMIAKSLMDRAVDILDQDAVARGSLAGCNAIFLETVEHDETNMPIVPISSLNASLASSSAASNSLVVSPPPALSPPIQQSISTGSSALFSSYIQAVKAASNHTAASHNNPSSSASTNKAMVVPPSSPISTVSSAGQEDPSKRTRTDPSGLDIAGHHQMLHRLGWRLVDFGYVAPSTRGRPRVHSSLAILLTKRIPRAETPMEDQDYYYLPRHTLTSFIEEHWRMTMLPSGVDYKKEPHFKHMMDLVTRRESIPLLDLPWTRPWTLVDLYDDFDAQLLYKFYQNSYSSSFPTKAEREPLSTWIQLLSQESRDSLIIEDFHVLLALQYPLLAGTTNASTKTSTTVILGGLIFTYYPSTGTGLLTYMSVPQQLQNRELLARSLLDIAAVNLNENAVLRGHIAGCNAIFMEAPLTQNPDRPDHDALYRGGWRALNFEYHRPPQSIFSSGGSRALLLALLTPNIPKEIGKDGQTLHVLPKPLLRTFLHQHWRTVYARIGKTIVTKDPNYMQMMISLEGVEQVTLMDLPWVPTSAPKL